MPPKCSPSLQAAPQRGGRREAHLPRTTLSHGCEPRRNASGGVARSAPIEPALSLTGTAVRPPLFLSQSPAVSLPQPPPSTYGNPRTAAASAATNSGGGGVSSHAQRMLKDSRASVLDPLRPETPAALAPSSITTVVGASSDFRRGAFRRKSHGATGIPVPRRGGRLAALPSPASEVQNPDLSSGSGMDDSELYLTRLRAAEAGPEAERVRTLQHMMRWLANPNHRLSEAWVVYLLNRVDAAVQEMQLQLEAVDGSSGQALSVPLTETLRVPLMMAAMMLRNTNADDCVAMPVILQMLTLLTEHGYATQLQQQLIFEPLLHILRMDTVLAEQPQMTLEVLRVFVCGTEKSAPCHPGAAADVTMELVTLGVVPTLNGLLEKVLGSKEAADHAGGTAGEDGNDVPLAMTYTSELDEVILTNICLLFRNLSSVHSDHLRKLGTLRLLTRVLEVSVNDTDVVTAASRALAKLVFDYDCLTQVQQDVRLLKAALHVLEVQLAMSVRSSAIFSPEADGTSATPLTSRVDISLLVSRLCCVIARVAEDCEPQQACLAQCGSQLLYDLLCHYGRHLPAANEEIRGDDGLLPSVVDVVDGDLTVMQGVVWLIAVAALSSRCTLHFVRHTVPLLAQFLQEVQLTSATRLTIIYSLMSLSNLSYYFPVLVSDDDSDAAVGNEAVDSHSSDGEGATGGRSSGPADWRSLQHLFRTLGPTLAGFLFEADVECAVEATRILGNMSYTNAGRDWLESSRCDEVVVVYLGHEDIRLTYNCFGILLNLTAGTHCRVVETPELLQRVLQHTNRFTQAGSIAAAAVDEAQRLVRRWSLSNGAASVALQPGSSRQGVTTATTVTAAQHQYVDPVRPRSATRSMASACSHRRDRYTSSPLSSSPPASTLSLLEGGPTIEEVAYDTARGYAQQTAEVVEKVLWNIRGLMSTSDGGPQPVIAPAAAAATQLVE